MRQKKTALDIRDTAPTIVTLDAKLTFNGGSISYRKVTTVWLAIQRALAQSAIASGLGFSWTAELHSTTPERMRARIDRQTLNIEHQLADPSVPVRATP